MKVSSGQVAAGGVSEGGPWGAEDTNKQDLDLSIKPNMD